MAVINEKEIFVEDERLLGRYTVVLLNKHNSGNWMPAVMQLDAVVTNYRLLLRPFRKKYRPASLPARYIRTADLVTRGKYHCIALTLSTDHQLHVMLSTGKLDDLHDDLSAMKSPPPKFQFDDSVAKNDIERLITFFGKRPLNES
ncbi:MAG: hypothetical protein AAFV93_15195 [Chloroflexota bacterium]